MDIGRTRRDHTPAHWQSNYPLTKKTKSIINDLHAKRHEIFEEMDNLPDNLTDEEFATAMNSISARLDALIDKEDEARLANVR